MYDKAIEDLETGLKYAPSDPQLLYRIGLANYANKDFKAAIRYLKTCLQSNPYVSYIPDTYYHIGLSYCNLEKFEKAIFPFEKCITAFPSKTVYIHERAKAYQMIEDHENAVKDFNAVIKK
jgi:tetratricopeptide (TPR) repeat protein